MKCLHSGWHGAAPEVPNSEATPCLLSTFVSIRDGQNYRYQRRPEVALSKSKTAECRFSLKVNNGNVMAVKIFHFGATREASFSLLPEVMLSCLFFCREFLFPLMITSYCSDGSKSRDSERSVGLSVMPRPLYPAHDVSSVFSMRGRHSTRPMHRDHLLYSASSSIPLIKYSILRKGISS
jgi:hypothetical protein